MFLSAAVTVDAYLAARFYDALHALMPLHQIAGLYLPKNTNNGVKVKVHSGFQIK